MKCRTLFIFVVLSFVITLLSGCKSEEEISGLDFYSSIKVEEFIKNQDYDGFKEILYKNDAISKVEFKKYGKEMNDNIEGVTSFRKFEVISYENGPMFLVQLVYGQEDGRPKVNNIKLVPITERNNLKNLLNITTN